MHEKLCISNGFKRETQWGKYNFVFCCCYARFKDSQNVSSNITKWELLKILQLYKRRKTDILKKKKSQRLHHLTSKTFIKARNTGNDTSWNFHVITIKTSSNTSNSFKNRTNFPGNKISTTKITNINCPTINSNLIWKINISTEEEAQRLWIVKYGTWEVWEGIDVVRWAE